MICHIQFGKVMGKGREKTGGTIGIIFKSIDLRTKGTNIQKTDECSSSSKVIKLPFSAFFSMQVLKEWIGITQASENNILYLGHQLKCSPFIEICMH